MTASNRRFRMYKYMIHTCLDREWYVRQFLIPSLLQEGIDLDHIILWIDKQKVGNLQSCMNAFKSLPEEGATWHLQDDIIICRDFKKKTQVYGQYAPIVCGFCYPEAGGKDSGPTPPSLMWYSFPCIKIDNQIAKTCSEWFFEYGQFDRKYTCYVSTGKFDDTMFKQFCERRYGDTRVCYNLKPNLVDHIDYLIGGSIVNKDRCKKITAAAFFEDHDQIIQELEEKLNNRQKQKNMRVAAYCGTRNLYQMMVPAIRSLLDNSNVERIYLVIEDDKFPYQLPPQVKIINGSNQTFFKKDGPNMNSRFTYMAMMRAALCYLLPHHDKVLSLDIDTIVVQDISDLWDIDLGDNYFVACVEPDRCWGGKWHKETDPRMYYNVGVTMFNLKKMREDKAEEIIQDLNVSKYDFIEQDCMNKLCQGGILNLSNDFNCMKYSGYQYCGHSFDPKIIHFAGIKDWFNINSKELKKYKEKKYDE